MFEWKKIKGIVYSKYGEQIVKLNEGKGKEYYYNGRLRFEGEYLNGKRWNGKYYNINGNIDYELKYGRGNCKEYNNRGKLLFEGEYLNGERNGKYKDIIMVNYYLKENI